jgi:hypothetical protein
MKPLHLVLKKKWFELIASGKKIKRIIKAWGLNGQDALMADAIVINNQFLKVINCNNKSIQVDFKSMPALKRIPQSERENFILSEEGSYLYWENADIHLDFDSIKDFYENYS